MWSHVQVCLFLPFGWLEEQHPSIDIDTILTHPQLVLLQDFERNKSTAQTRHKNPLQPFGARESPAAPSEPGAASPSEPSSGGVRRFGDVTGFTGGLGVVEHM